eukprot:4381643-Amphidinium_carterae.1
MWSFLRGSHGDKGLSRRLPVVKRPQSVEVRSGSVPANQSRDMQHALKRNAGSMEVQAASKPTVNPIMTCQQREV